MSLMLLKCDTSESFTCLHVQFMSDAGGSVEPTVKINSAEQ
jgi:hypothetical protein